jgi:hypothetical protein
VRRLLDARVSTSLRNRQGAAAVDVAEARNFPEVVKLLDGT